MTTWYLVCRFLHIILAVQVLSGLLLGSQLEQFHSGSFILIVRYNSMTAQTMMPQNVITVRPIVILQNKKIQKPSNLLAKYCRYIHAYHL